MKDLKDDFMQLFEFRDFNTTVREDLAQLPRENVERELAGQITILHQPLIKDSEFLCGYYPIGHDPTQEVHQITGNWRRTSANQCGAFYGDLNRHVRTSSRGGRCSGYTSTPLNARQHRPAILRISAGAIARQDRGAKAAPGADPIGLKYERSRSRRRLRRKGVPDGD